MRQYKFSPMSSVEFAFFYKRLHGVGSPSQARHMTVEALTGQLHVLTSSFLGRFQEQAGGGQLEFETEDRFAHSDSLRESLVTEFVLSLGGQQEIAELSLALIEDKLDRHLTAGRTARIDGFGDIRLSAVGDLNAETRRLHHKPFNRRLRQLLIRPRISLTDLYQLLENEVQSRPRIRYSILLHEVVPVHDPSDVTYPPASRVQRRPAVEELRT